MDPIDIETLEDESVSYSIPEGPKVRISSEVIEIMNRDGTVQYILGNSSVEGNQPECPNEIAKRERKAARERADERRRIEKEKLAAENEAKRVRSEYYKQQENMGIF